MGCAVTSPCPCWRWFSGPMGEGCLFGRNTINRTNATINAMTRDMTSHPVLMLGTYPLAPDLRPCGGGGPDQVLHADTSVPECFGEAKGDVSDDPRSAVDHPCVDLPRRDSGFETGQCVLG